MFDIEPYNTEYMLVLFFILSMLFTLSNMDTRKRANRRSIFADVDVGPEEDRSAGDT